MPTKYLHLDGDLAIHYAHAGPTTLPHVPPPLHRGRAIVFLHGEGGSAALWERQVAHFGAAHSPLAVDLPGHGRSSGLLGPESVGAAARLVARVLEAVKAPPAVLVGHGLGGQVALATALDRPQLVRAVMTIGTACKPEVDAGGLERLRQVVQGRLGQQFDTPFFGPSPDFAVMRTFWGEMVKTDPRVRLGDVEAYLASDLRESLGRLTQPVLILQGEADRLCSRARAEELAAGMPNARVAVIEGAGHVAHLEQPDAVHRAIEELLAQ